jgi:hypothetical protein
MPGLDQTIMYELSRMAVAPVSPAELSDFISRRIIRSFAAKYHIVWLVKEGLTYPSLYSLDDDLTSNLYTQQLIKTSYKLNDGVWDKLWKGNKTAVMLLGLLYSRYRLKQRSNIQLQQKQQEINAQGNSSSGEEQSSDCHQPAEYPIGIPGQ